MDLRCGRYRGLIRDQSKVVLTAPSRKAVSKDLIDGKWYDSFHSSGERLSPSDAYGVKGKTLRSSSSGSGGDNILINQE